MCFCLSVHKKLFHDFNKIWLVDRSRCTRQYALWPDPRSRSRRSESCENGGLQSLYLPPICT